MSSQESKISIASANLALNRRKDVYMFPISMAQRRLWFLDQLLPGNPAYNIPLSVRIRGNLDVKALERALSEIVARHETLRTTFAQEKGEPVQIVASSGRACMATVNLTDLAPEERELEAVHLVSKEAVWNFDLQRGPLLRVLLIRLGAEEHVLSLTMHHIVADGWSFEVLLRELSVLYESFSRHLPSPLAQLPIQYGDFTLWQQEWLSSGQLAEQLTYWKHQLRDVSALHLPTDHRRPRVPSWHGRSLTFSLPAGLTEALRELSRREKTTLFTTLLASYLLLLHRYSQQDDICVGSPIANRIRTELEGLIGFFANTLVLRGDLSGNPTFRELLQRVRKMTLEAYCHQDVPFEKLVHELQPERNVARNPLFQVSFSLEQDFSQEIKLSDLVLIAFPVDVVSTRFDLEAHLLDSMRGIRGDFIYSSELFEAETARRMADHYQVLLQSIVAAPDQRLSQLALLTQGERNQLLYDWNRTSAPYSTGRCVPQLFEAQAESHPERLAAASSEGFLSYAELNRQANRLARYLRHRGMRPGDLVGVCVPRSVDMVIGLLGVLKAGGTYVPLDPLYPAERLRFILEDADSRLLLTESELLGKLRDTQAELICLDTDWQSVEREGPENLEAAVTSNDLAYVIYTSGSTGRPKGVEIEHGSLLNLIYWHQRAYDVTPRDRATQLAAPSFDASVWELWPYLTAGASVHIPDEGIRCSPAALVEWLAANEITLTFLPTPLAEAVLEQEFPSRLHLRALLTGGDRLRRSPRRELPFRLVNHYGPTENSVVATCCDIAPFEQGVPPIGRPISNVKVYILDPQRQLVPIGTPGKLYIGGLSLARGYHNRPALTAERFLPHPFGTTSGERVYDTGDLVRYRPDGQLEFLGRTDEQVKIRGFRIELGEIEAALAAHPDVANSVVIAREDSPGENRLVAYVVPRQRPGPAVSSLRAHLRTSLPEHMIPSAFVLLDALPLSPHGKVDTRALPPPEQSENMEPQFDSPQSNLRRARADETENRIAALWQEVLGVKNVGVEDNFFDLGGHSLLMVQVHGAIRRSLSVDVSIMDLFRYPTVKSLAEFLRNGVGGSLGIRNALDRAVVRREAVNRHRQLKDLRREMTGVPAPQSAVVESKG